LGYTKWLINALLAAQVIAADVLAGERAGLRDAPTVPGRLAHSARLAARNPDPTAPLDWVASAVDGAESSHGSDMAMWRPDPSGPQGPMQVSEAAATDVGGGDRFDALQNRAIGRAYLLQLYDRRLQLGHRQDGRLGQSRTTSRPISRRHRGVFAACPPRKRPVRRCRA
jgi:hypothetical protein